MDMGKAFAKSAAEHAPAATVCLDPYHVVAVRHEAPCIRGWVRGPPLRAVAAVR